MQPRADGVRPPTMPWFASWAETHQRLRRSATPDRRRAVAGDAKNGRIDALADREQPMHHERVEAVRALHGPKGQAPKEGLDPTTRSTQVCFVRPTTGAFHPSHPPALSDPPPLTIISDDPAMRFRTLKHARSYRLRRLRTPPSSTRGECT